MNTFDSYSLSPQTAGTLQRLGYKNPTPIQELALPLLLGESCDLIGLAATGTGKTLAFGIPMVESIDPKLKRPQALVLCPTRELAQQVSTQLVQLGSAQHLMVATIYGGAGYGDQIKSLRSGAQIVVATPGRLIDHLERGTLTLDSLKVIVLDEADEMISMGFKEDLEQILSNVSGLPHRTWMFSATMSAQVRKIADEFLESPKVVQTNRGEMLSGTVKQIFYMTKESDKPEILSKLIDVADDFYGIIFCQTKSLTQSLSTLLQNRGYRAECLHGDKSQAEREKILSRFKSKELSVLVCTDVAARGLDIKEVTHVINYSIPRELDNYVHRIGRTGRNGQSGLALSLVTPSHLPLISKIERLTKTPIERGTIPTKKEVAQRKMDRLQARLKSVENFEPVQKLIEEHWKAELESMSGAELLARLLAATQPDLIPTRREEKMSLHHDGGERTVVSGRRMDRGPASRSGGSERYRRSEGGDRSYREERSRGGGDFKPRAFSPSNEGARLERRSPGASRPVSARSSGGYGGGTRVSSRPRREEFQPEIHDPQTRRPKKHWGSEESRSESLTQPRGGSPREFFGKRKAAGAGESRSPRRKERGERVESGSRIRDRFAKTERTQKHK